MPDDQQRSDGVTPTQEEDRREAGRSERAAAAEGSGKHDGGGGKKPGFIRRHPVAIIVGLVVLALLAVGGYIYWLRNIHPFETTDDAFVDSRQFPIAPKVTGYVTEVAVADNQHVQAGDLLFRIDPRDYQTSELQAKAQIDSAQAAIDSADAQIAAQRAQIDQARAEVTQAQAAVKFAEEDAARYRDLQSRGAGTVQQAQQSAANLQEQQAKLTSANAAVLAAERQVGALQGQRASAVADLARAKAQLAQAQLDLSYATVTAAQSGRVVQLSGAVGQYAQAGQSLAIFVPDDKWVTANFKETQITDMRPGQPVDISIDAYPDRKVTGRVDSVQPGSGTAFSLLPAQNATGNYVKVVQRVPVKITVDQWPDGVSIGPGMSVVPTVTVR
ncbi:HlyD family secretion protein [Azospirillum picis]|uniref:Membrane fusion protein (Multidrug efflux system) n=1 Tax=Azospirillum picis TaxID=488438 RepID=A0ABU0MHN4_9PROT|nr:HlyD family secretion protein [Azospirillum picis]MBP2298825.1 membrane fusion protein (multidrug efflux system) [Azospirillum picis]MDQ0532933.1 membrane fusion protein (multidrug efflux system) [Azospirillum picis]